MEFTYKSDLMRQVATDETEAKKLLGADLAPPFLSLIADMADAMYLAEVMDFAEDSHTENACSMNFPISSDAWLAIEPVTKRVITAESLKNVHRIKLVHVYHDGVVLI